MTINEYDSRLIDLQSQFIKEIEEHIYNEIKDIECIETLSFYTNSNEFKINDKYYNWEIYDYNSKGKLVKQKLDKPLNINLKTINKILELVDYVIHDCYRFWRSYFLVNLDEHEQKITYSKKEKKFIKFEEIE